MITSKEIEIGQSVSASLWFRCGLNGDNKDYSCITGTVTRKLDCYNQILVDVDIEKSFNTPSKTVWVDLNKSELIINN